MPGMRRLSLLFLLASAVASLPAPAHAMPICATVVVTVDGSPHQVGPNCLPYTGQTACLDRTVEVTPAAIVFVTACLP
jgi:hypothetical protein